MNSLVVIVISNGFKHELIGKIIKATTASAEADRLMFTSVKKNKIAIVKETTKLLIIIQPILTSACIIFIVDLVD